MSGHLDDILSANRAARRAMASGQAELERLREENAALRALLARVEVPQTVELLGVGIISSNGGVGKVSRLSMRVPSFDEQEGAAITWSTGGSVVAGHVGAAIDAAATVVVVGIGDRFLFF